METAVQSCAPRSLPLLDGNDVQLARLTAVELSVFGARGHSSPPHRLSPAPSLSRSNAGMEHRHQNLIFQPSSPARYCQLPPLDPPTSTSQEMRCSPTSYAVSSLQQQQPPMVINGEHQGLQCGLQYCGVSQLPNQPLQLEHTPCESHSLDDDTLRPTSMYYHLSSLAYPCLGEPLAPVTTTSPCTSHSPTPQVIAAADGIQRVARRPSDVSEIPSTGYSVPMRSTVADCDDPSPEDDIHPEEICADRQSACDAISTENDDAAAVVSGAGSSRKGRTEVTIQQKRQICLYHEQNPTVKARDVVDYFHRQWGQRIGRSTVAGVLGNKKHWLSVSEDQGKIKRQRSGVHCAMEQRLYAWYADMRADCKYVSRQQLCCRAREIGRQLGIPDTFGYSKGWLQKFQLRYNFRFTSNKSDTDAASKSFFQLKRRQLENDLKSTDPEDVFFFDELSLMYGMLPCRSCVDSALMRRSVVVCLSSNVTGTDRLAPLVVSRCVNSGFNSGFSLAKLLDYRHSGSGRLTEFLFTDWLYALDASMRADKRSILLLIGDNIPRRLERYYRLSNIRIRFLSTVIGSTSSSTIRSPLDAGLGVGFKALFRHLQLTHCLQLGDDHLQAEPLQLRSALYIIRDSWRQLPRRQFLAAAVSSQLVSGLRLGNDAVPTRPAAAQEHHVELAQCEGPHQHRHETSVVHGMSAPGHVELQQNVSANSSFPLTSPAVGCSPASSATTSANHQLIELVEHLRRVIQNLRIPESQRCSAEWLLNVEDSLAETGLGDQDPQEADRRLKQETSDDRGWESPFQWPPDSVTLPEASCAIGVLLAYLEERNAPVEAIDQVLAIRQTLVQDPVSIPAATSPSHRSYEHV